MRHDGQVWRLVSWEVDILPICGEYVLETTCRADVDGQASSDDVQIFAVENERAIDDVDEESDVPSGRRFAVDRGEE